MNEHTLPATAMSSDLCALACADGDGDARIDTRRLPAASRRAGARRTARGDATPLCEECQAAGQGCRRPDRRTSR